MAWFQFCASDSVDFNPEFGYSMLQTECCSINSWPLNSIDMDRIGLEQTAPRPPSNFAVKLILILFVLVVLVLPPWLIWEQKCNQLKECIGFYGCNLCWYTKDLHKRVQWTK